MPKRSDPLCGSVVAGGSLPICRGHNSGCSQEWCAPDPAGSTTRPPETEAPFMSTTRAGISSKVSLGTAFMWSPMHWRYRVALCHHQGQRVPGVRAQHRSDPARGAGPAQSAHRSGRHVALVGSRGVEQPQAAVLHVTEEVGSEPAKMSHDRDTTGPAAGRVSATSVSA